MFEARCASVDCACALLASDVPCTFDSGAILSFANGGTSTARFKFVGSVEALEIATETSRARNGTCGETHRTKLSVVYCTLALRITTGGLGMRRVIFLAAHLVRRPFMVVGALRFVTRGRLVRNAAAVLVTP